MTKILLLTLCAALSGCNLVNIIKMRYANDDVMPQWLTQNSHSNVHAYYEGNKPYIIATINGVDGFRFMIDTGASMTYLIDTPKVSALALRKGFSFEMGGWGDEEDSTIYQSEITTLEFGKVMFKSVNVALLPVSRSKYFLHPEEAIFDGVIGHDVLHHFSWTFDKTNNFISISREPYVTTGNEDSIPFDTFLSKISIPVRVDFGGNQQTTTDFIIDTGSRHYAKISASYVANNIELTRKTVTAADFGLSGKTVHQRTTLPSMTIGSQKLLNVKTGLIGPDDDEDENWVIGSALLNQFVTVLDYHTQTLHIQTDATFQFQSKYNLLGLELRKMSNGQFIVRHIFNNLPASTVGVTEGDWITAINGLSSESLSLEQWLDISTTPDTHQICRARKLPNDNSEMKTQDRIQCFEIESHHIKGYSDL